MTDRCDVVGPITVAELIERLQQFPADLPVEIGWQEDPADTRFQLYDSTPLLDITTSTAEWPLPARTATSVLIIGHPSDLMATSADLCDTCQQAWAITTVHASTSGLDGVRVCATCAAFPNHVDPRGLHSHDLRHHQPCGGACCIGWTDCEACSTTVSRRALGESA